jgi:hypothetical protein
MPTGPRGRLLPDPCLGLLPGVTDACCGHGDRSRAFVAFENGVLIRGFDWVEHHRPRRRPTVIQTVREPSA